MTGLHALVRLWILWTALGDARLSAEVLGELYRAADHAVEAFESERGPEAAPPGRPAAAVLPARLPALPASSAVASLPSFAPPPPRRSGSPSSWCRACRSSTPSPGASPDD
jgi:hypothetical protein